MKSDFGIYLSSSEIDRPPISHKVLEYFVQFITDNIIKKKGIIIDSKWNVRLAIFFISEGERYKSKEIFLAKGGPRTVSENRIKLYEIIIPLKLIQESKNPFLKTIELIFEANKVFFTTVYKKVTVSYINSLWEKVDLNYLLSLTYPAPKSEQKYVGDEAGNFSN